MACYHRKTYAATLAHAVHVCEHKFDVTFMECVATLAHVVNVREHKFDVMLIEYDVMLAHTQQKKHLNKWKPIPFAQKDKSHGGTKENRWEWARSFQWSSI